MTFLSAEKWKVKEKVEPKAARYHPVTQRYLGMVQLTPEHIKSIR